MKVVEIVLVLLLPLISVGEDADEKEVPCKVTMWQPTLVVQRMSISPVVVLGEIYGYKSSVKDKTFDALFRVHCVLKSDNVDVKQEILIENIYPRNGCSGTKDQVLKNELSVVGLGRLESGNFEWHEKNPLESISVAGSYNLLDEFSSTCGLQNWTVPLGSNESECKVCSPSLGVVGKNDTCMMTNIYNTTCTPIPEFKIFSHCVCSEKHGTVLSNSERKTINLLLLYLICLAMIL